MRNLKKFLALVLAMMMVFSLMVTVNAATYPDMDKAEDAFVEGIEVLSGVGVIKGDEKGNFNPTANITRAEAAAIMYRIVTGDVKDEHNGLHTGAVQFTDVKDGDWFAGYVGYCADQGIIKGRPDGSFGPQANVTGYEMLAMLLRAIGYGQKGEFTGYGWEVSVGSRATTLGILDNVKTTAYGGNLRLAARRDVVADLAFQSITVPPTVTVSSLGDYNQYTSLVSGVLNPTLGDKVFGLASMTGIVVGNQATGEKFTLLGKGINANKKLSGVSYAYYTSGSTNPTDATGANVNDTNLALDGTDHATITFNTKTDLDKFGHQVTIWYDSRTSRASVLAGNKAANGVNATFASQFATVYAVRDGASKVELVKVTGVSGNTPDVSDTTTAGELGTVAKALGFAVSNTTKARFSDTYARFDSNPQVTAYVPANDGKAASTPDSAFDNATKDIYMLISNSANKALDVVINVDLVLDRISAVNNYTSPKTVATWVDESSGNYADNKGGAGDTLIYRAVPATPDQGLLLSGEDNIAVGAFVVRNTVYGTSASANYTGSNLGSFNYYGLEGLTEKKGTVSSVSGTGKVTLTDGTTLDASVVWDTATPNPLCNAGALKIGATLTFKLDAFGKYTRVEAGGATKLVGAYGYWTQEGIDGFKYFLQGVTDEGTIATVEVTEATYKSVIADKTDNSSPAIDIHHMGVVSTSTGSNVGVVNPSDPLPATSVNGYGMYSVNENKVLSQGRWNGNIYKIQDGTDGDSPAQPVKNTLLTKNSTSIKTKADDTALNNENGTPNYFTADTKFHVITGWGSTLKVETKVGLTALLDGAVSMEVEGWIKVKADDTEHTSSGNYVITDVYLVNTKSIQPNTFFYVKDAHTVGTGDPMSNDDKAVQLQVYANGADTSTGVLVSSIKNVGDATATATVDNNAQNSQADLKASTFYRFTVNADGYYDLEAENVDGSGYGYSSDELTNAGTASGDISDGTVTIHAANAKVVDVTGVDHGITDYMSLRRAVEQNKGIKVDVLLSGPLNNNVGTAVLIYVYHVQVAAAP